MSSNGDSECLEARMLVLLNPALGGIRHWIEFVVSETNRRCNFQI